MSAEVCSMFRLQKCMYCVMADSKTFCKGSCWAAWAERVAINIDGLVQPSSSTRYSDSALSYTTTATCIDVYKYSFFSKNNMWLEFPAQIVSVEIHPSISSWHVLLLTPGTPAVAGRAHCMVPTKVLGYLPSNHQRSVNEKDQDHRAQDQDNKIMHGIPFPAKDKGSTNLHSFLLKLRIFLDSGHF